MSTRDKLYTHPIVAAHFVKEPSHLATQIEGVADAIESNKETFNPTPSEVATARQDISSLREAIRVAAAHAPGTVAARTALAAAVRHDGYMLVKVVQTAANKLPYDLGVKLILGSRLSVNQVGRRQPKAELAIYQGVVSGTVRAVALALPRPTTYYFEFSADGKAWTTLPGVHVSNLVITGLTVGQTYSFRFHALTKNTPKEPSIIVPFLVK